MSNGHILSDRGREALDLHLANTASAFGRQVGQQYSATPSVAQTVYEKVVENGNPFLSSVNVLPVTEIKGDKVGLSLSGRVAGRTDTSGSNERVPKHLMATDSKGYELFKTEFDVALKYAQIDLWAKFPDFAARYMNMVRLAISNDMVQCGWTGTSHAATTNIITNPNLEDLNIGWLKLIRDFNGGSQRVVGTGPSPISIGSTGVFKNLDALVHEAKQRLPVWYRKVPGLVALVSDDVISAQESVYFEVNGNKPTEKTALNSNIMKAYGGLPTLVPPFMPDGTLLITTLNNLSIYYQNSSVRRLQKDKPEKDEVQDFNSVNMGYVLEDELLTSLVENITLVD